MNLEESIELFSIDDLTVETDSTLKSKYRKLMVKYHPDNCKGDESKAVEVSAAYEILKETLKEIGKYKSLDSKRETLTVIIPLSKLIHIYKGGEITVGSDDNQRKINRRDIQKHNTLIISNVAITHNGITNIFSNIQHWSISDKYAIDCEINVNELNSKEKILIQLESFRQEICFTSQAASMIVPLEFNISVEIKIVKKLRK